jgi:hypothetical protein
VVFGDHSHEPVPLAVARVSDAVAAMGGADQVALRRKYMCASSAAGGSAGGSARDDSSSDGQQLQQQGGGEALGRIPLPDVKQPPALEELQQQAAQQALRQAAAAQGATFSAPAGGGAGGSTASQPAEDGGDCDEAVASSAPLGAWPEAWPQRVLGDAVCAFDELSAAQGSLGRFTGAGVMPLLKQFGGWRSPAALA